MFNFPNTLNGREIWGRLRALPGRRCMARSRGRRSVGPIAADNAAKVRDALSNGLSYRAAAKAGDVSLATGQRIAAGLRQWSEAHDLAPRSH
jgi:DNA invertase Pin-like site-specific DNA recombinase